MKLLNTSIEEIKKSKFIGLYYDINSIEEIKDILNELKVEHKKAKHIVYAYKYQNTAGKSDDKEPSGTAGLPLYNLLETKFLELVISRSLEAIPFISDTCLVLISTSQLILMTTKVPIQRGVFRFHFLF